MADTNQDVTIKLYPVRTALRELWSDVCSFGTVVAFFGIGWWFDSTAMQWFAFVCCFLIFLARSGKIVKQFGAQEAADYLYREYGVRAEDKGAKSNG